MIWEAFFSAVTAVITTVLAVLPAWSDPTWADGFADTIFELGVAANPLDAWIHVPILVAMLGLILAAFVTVFLARVAVFVWKLLPLT